MTNEEYPRRLDAIIWPDGSTSAEIVERPDGMFAVRNFYGATKYTTSNYAVAKMCMAHVALKDRPRSSSSKNRSNS